MWGSGLVLATAVIPLFDRAAGDRADRAAEDRADGLGAAARNLVPGQAARDRADHGAAGAIVALAIAAVVVAIVVIAAVVAPVIAVGAAVVAPVVTVVAVIAGIMARIAVAVVIARLCGGGRRQAQRRGRHQGGDGERHRLFHLFSPSFRSAPGRGGESMMPFCPIRFAPGDRKRTRLNSST